MISQSYAQLKLLQNLVAKLNNTAINNSFYLFDVDWYDNSYNQDMYELNKVNMSEEDFFKVIGDNLHWDRPVVTFNKKCFSNIDAKKLTQTQLAIIHQFKVDWNKMFNTKPVKLK